MFCKCFKGALPKLLKAAPYLALLRFGEACRLIKGRQATAELANKLGYEPSDADVAKKLGTTAQQIAKWRRADANYVSLMPHYEASRVRNEWPM